MGCTLYFQGSLGVRTNIGHRAIVRSAQLDQVLDIIGAKPEVSRTPRKLGARLRVPTRSQRQARRLDDDVIGSLNKGMEVLPQEGAFDGCPNFYRGAEVCIQIRTPLACTTCASDDETQYLDKDSTRVVRTRRALFVKEIRREKLPYAAVGSVRIRSALVVITNIICEEALDSEGEVALFLIYGHLCVALI